MGHRARNRVITRAFGAFGVKDHIDRLFHFDAAGLARGADLSHVDRHGLPRGVKELVSIKEGSDASFTFAGKQLEERGEVFGAHDFSGKRAMQEVESLSRCTFTVVARGFKAQLWSRGPGRVYKVERCAEEARKRMV